jgi:2-polyprenyl-3-methyl-5-hydroxy-6-metoxy-1,4-benzoquinol methylase
VKNYLIDSKHEDKRLDFQNTIDVYNLEKELEFFSFENHQAVLDAGCGNGNVIEKLIRKNIPLIHAVDLSQERVDRWSKRTFWMQPMMLPLSDIFLNTLLIQKQSLQSFTEF